MNGFSSVRNRSKARYHRTRNSFNSFCQPSSCRAAAHPSTSGSKLKLKPKPKTICARLHRFFNFTRSSKSQARDTMALKPIYRDEKPYHHVPVHAANTFLNSTTTGAMADVQALERYEPDRVWSEKGEKANGSGEVGRFVGEEFVWDEKKLIDTVEVWRRSTLACAEV